MHITISILDQADCISNGMPRLWSYPGLPWPTWKNENSNTCSMRPTDGHHHSKWVKQTGCSLFGCPRPWAWHIENNSVQYVWDKGNYSLAEMATQNFPLIWWQMWHFSSWLEWRMTMPMTLMDIGDSWRLQTRSFSLMVMSKWIDLGMTSFSWRHELTFRRSYLKTLLLETHILPCMKSKTCQVLFSYCSAFSLLIC